MNILLTVSGMSCGHCVSTIEGGLGKLEGVTKVKVSLEKGEVDITTNSDSVTAELLIAEIDDLGFDAEVK